MDYISYLRVSTAKQSTAQIEGFGIAGQRDSCKRFIKKNDRLIKEYIEVESGSKSDRPILRHAIEECERTGCTLLIARIDRLARNVQFVSTLMKSNIKFKCADMPEADNFTIHVLAAVAEKERDNISKQSFRTHQILKMTGKKRDGTPYVNKGFSPQARKAQKALQAERLVYKYANDPKKHLFKKMVGELRALNMTWGQVADYLNKIEFKRDRSKVPWNRDTTLMAYKSACKDRTAILKRREKRINDAIKMSEHVLELATDEKMLEQERLFDQILNEHIASRLNG